MKDAAVAGIVIGGLVVAAGVTFVAIHVSRAPVAASRTLTSQMAYPVQNVQAGAAATTLGPRTVAGGLSGQLQAMTVGSVASLANKILPGSGSLIGGVANKALSTVGSAASSAWNAITSIF